MEANQQLLEKETEEENPDDALKALLCNKKLYSKLYPHQRDGILFLYNAYKKGKSGAEGSRNGVILADEMGLGKSIQVIVFLHFMIINTHKLKNALLVMPAGLLSDWKDKLEKWTPDMNVFIYQNSEKELPRKLRQLQKNGGILLISYKMFIYHHKALTTYKGMSFVWDCLIFDEAHKLKNSATKTHKVAASISAGFHILMTGTPIQNNLKEYWTLFSLISDTCLLGTYKTFKTNFENPITKGMAADSGPDERALGMKLQEELEKITEPFLLRRRKDQIQDPSDQTPSERGLCLPKKNEYVVWIKLSPEQEAAYCNIVDESHVLTFQAIHYLIAVCTHPRLNSDIMGHEASEVLLAESGKLAFMLALLERLTANGNFALVFSNYIKILDIIQKALTQTPWGRKAFLRIDGQNPNQRDTIIRRFQKKRSENILLLTTSVGAEGLTLTAADSVVFADLSWNQSLDAQAVGRAHRIGQTKEVTTYRLVTCGTLEETMYRRQLFKGALTRQSMGDELNPLRHFTQDELKTYLTLQQTQFSYTQQQLKKQGAEILHINEIFGEGFNSLGAAHVCGISDHGQLLSASQGEDLEEDMARMYISETAKMCKQEIEAEFHLTRQLTGEDLSVRKCFKKGKIRRKTQKVRTPGLPRKYKCFKTPFSGTRRKTLHISRPCVFESSDDSANHSADDDVSSSEKSLPHISFSVKSEATSDLDDNSNTYTSNSTCIKGNSGTNKSLNPKDTVEVFKCISNDCQSTELDPDVLPVTDLNMDSPSVADKDESGSPETDLEQDVSSVAEPVSSSVYAEHISTPTNSELVSDNVDNTSDSSDFSDSQSHKSSASNTMDEHSFSTSPEDSAIEKSGSSYLPEANTSENIATDTSMPEISLVQHNETDDSTDLKEEANILGANFKDPKIENIPERSEQNEMICDKTALNINSDSYQDPPHISPLTPYASPCTTQKMILNQEDQKLQEASKDLEVDMADVGIKETTTTEKSGTSDLLDAKNISVCTAIDSSICKSMSNLSLVKSSDLSDLKEEADPKGVKFTFRREFQNQINSEYEECVPVIPLNLNTLFSENSLQSTTPENTPELQKKEPQLSDSSCEDFKTDLKSNQVVSVLCDYSLTPSCISVCVTPSAGNGRHNTELRQLGECEGFSVLKEEETCPDISTTFLDLSTHSSEFHLQLNLPQIQGSESVQSSSEREVNIKDDVADISYKKSFKRGLKFSQTALKLCDYSLTPGCMSLVDTPSVDKGKHALSGNFQSTPLQSGQVVPQESLDHLIRRLPFSQGNSSTLDVKLCESRQENDSENNLSQVRKTTMDRNEVQIINPEKQVEQRKISMNKTADKHAFNAKEYSHLAEKINDTTFSPTTPEWKYGKENHDGLKPTLCDYSLNSSAFSQSSPQAGRMTKIQPVKRQDLTREDTEDTDQLFRMNRAIDTNQPENHMSRAKTIVSEMFSSKNASIIKALGNLLFQKRQHRRTRRDFSNNSKRPNLSMTYRRHKKKLLKTMKNVYKNPMIVDRSDAHVSLTPNENIHGLVAKKSASVSPSVSSPKLTKEPSPTQKIQGSIQYRSLKPLNGIPEGESTKVQSPKIVNVNVKPVHGLCTEGSLKTPVLRAISSSPTLLNQVIQSSNTDNYPRVQECSTENTMKSASYEDNEDHELRSTSQDEIFLLSPISSVPDSSVTSNGQLFTSGYRPMWDMSFSPEIQDTPRKESHIPKVINQANSNPHKMKIEQFSDNESPGQQLAFERYMDCCLITENNDDDSDVSVEQALVPVATLVTYNVHSPSEEIVIAERDESGGIRGLRDARQFCNQTNRASEISEIQPQAQEMGGYAKEPLEEGQESMLRYTENDTKSEKASALPTSVDEIFCLLHKLKRL